MISYLEAIQISLDKIHNIQNLSEEEQKNIVKKNEINSETLDIKLELKNIELKNINEQINNIKQEMKSIKHELDGGKVKEYNDIINLLSSLYNSTYPNNEICVNPSEICANPINATLNNDLKNLNDIKKNNNITKTSESSKKSDQNDVFGNGLGGVRDKLHMALINITEEDIKERLNSDIKTINEVINNIEDKDKDKDNIDNIKKQLAWISVIIDIHNEIGQRHFQDAINIIETSMLNLKNKNKQLYDKIIEKYKSKCEEYENNKNNIENNKNNTNNEMFTMKSSTDRNINNIINDKSEYVSLSVKHNINSLHHNIRKQLHNIFHPQSNML